jgi:hypothetical protein
MDILRGLFKINTYHFVNLLLYQYIKTLKYILRNSATKKCLVFFLSLLSFLDGKSQQPAYFSFAEDQFRGVQVYDVIQDKKLNYWFATNEGLYSFNFYKFQKVECDKAKSNSVFNFAINKEGTIYCHNLNNQIFQLKNNKLSLFYELELDESSSDITLSIGDDGNLVIGAKKILVLDKNGKKIKLLNTANHYLGSAFITQKDGIQFHLGGSDTIVIYKAGHFSKIKLTILSGNLEDQSVFKFFSINFSSYALDLRTKELYSYNPSKFELSLLPKNNLFQRSGSIRIYETAFEAWIAGTLSGITLTDKKILSKDYPTYYDNYFISDVFKDNEGNILLSTFDKGILVIPDIKVPDVINSFKEDPASALYSDSLLGLLIGTTKGNLIKYNNSKLSIISNKGKRPIEGIYGNAKSDFILFDDDRIRAYNKHTNTITNILDLSLKDVVYVSKNKLYLGTNLGVFQVKIDTHQSFKVEELNELLFRIYSLEYNFEDSCLYTSTKNGLYVVFTNGIPKPLLLNNEVIFPNYLHYYDGNIYASTKKNGILILKNGKIKNTIRPIINGNAVVLKKMLIHNNTIIAQTADGLFQFDMNGKVLKSIHSRFGFSSKRIIDFTIHQQQLWVSHAGGVQQINLNYTNQKVIKPVVRFDNVLVNDEIINPTPFSSLKSHQRKIQFVFSSPTLKNHESIFYHFKLIGYDTKWNINNYETNQITYSALAPGTYTFCVKAETQGVFSEQITYSFSIATPYYLRWWFIVSVIILFLIIVFVIYRWQLTIQQQKSQQMNELNTSRLTAIQSQMNPHFIFNSLNSIQDLILKGDVEHSYTYITMFSNLVRRTLSYSEKDFIDFDQELKLLELYLSLEKLRFKKDFNYTIHFKGVEDILLPPLLVQPFIENSLIHGLLHKEGVKKLSITFELKDNLLQCVVEDNGIGREKAKAIKLRQRSEHESFSGKAIHKRFEILSNVFKGNFGYVYEDLVENNEVIGTKVILSIPIKHTF